MSQPLKSGSWRSQLWVVLWSGFVLVFDGYVAWNLYRQIRTNSYGVTAGVVIESKVSVHNTRRNRTMNVPEIRYNYSVNGMNFVGTRYRYGFTASRDAKEIVASHSRGATVTVHFNPHDASDAVLKTGVEGSDLWALLFIAPFNIIMGVGWFLLFLSGRDQCANLSSVGVTGFQYGCQLRVRLPHMTPTLVSILTAVASCIGAILIIGLSLGTNPPVAVMLTAIGLILVSVIGVYRWRSSVIKSGVKDLIIDHFSRTLVLPRSGGQGEAQMVSFNVVNGVGVEHIQKDNKRSEYALYLLVRNDGSRHRQTIGIWTDSVELEAIATLIRKELQL
jgi:hypothetical protein